MPEAIFRPDYLPGTRAVSTLETIAVLQTFMCEQATDHNSTSSSFQLAIFSSAINAPGPTASNATFSLVAHDLATNHAALAGLTSSAGHRTFLVGSFALARPLPATEGQTASPYTLAVPAAEPLFSFRGTMSAKGSASNPDQFVMNYYTMLDAQLFLTRLTLTAHAAGPSQAATATFDGKTYWASKGGPPEWEGINFLHEKASGSIQFEVLSAF